MTEEAGFKDFKWVSFGVSEVQNLSNLERHAEEEWMKDGMIMIYEASK